MGLAELGTTTNARDHSGHDHEWFLIAALATETVHIWLHWSGDMVCGLGLVVRTRCCWSILCLEILYSAITGAYSMHR